MMNFMMCYFSNLLGNRKGQGMVEYALLVGLISIVCIVVLVLLGPQLKAIFQQVVNALTGAATPAP